MGIESLSPVQNLVSSVIAQGESQVQILNKDRCSASLRFLAPDCTYEIETSIAKNGRGFKVSVQVVNSSISAEYLQRTQSWKVCVGERVFQEVKAGYGPYEIRDLFEQLEALARMCR